MYSVARQTCSKPVLLVVCLFLHVPVGGTRFFIFAFVCKKTYTSTHTHMQKCIIHLKTKHSIPTPSWTQLKTEDSRGLYLPCVEVNKLRKLTIKLPAVRVQLVYKTLRAREGERKKRRRRRGRGRNRREEGKGDEGNLCKGKTG